MRRSTGPIASKAARAAGRGTSMETSGPGLEVCWVSGKVSPTMPTRTAPKSRASQGQAPPKGRRVCRSSTLAESQRNRDSRIRSRRTAGPQSNS